MPRLSHSRCLDCYGRASCCRREKARAREPAWGRGQLQDRQAICAATGTRSGAGHQDWRMGRQGIGSADDRHRHKRPAAPAQLISITTAAANKWPWRRVGAQGLLGLCPSADRTRSALNSDAKRLHAAIRLVVSTMSGKTAGPGLQPCPGTLGLPRLRAIAEPYGTVRWGHASAPLSVAPTPVPTGIREPALAQAACRRAGDQKDNWSLQLAPVEVNP